MSATAVQPPSLMPVGRVKRSVAERDPASTAHRIAAGSPNLRRPHPPALPSSRSLKRWILPVAVFGSSVRNSIQRGYFHVPALVLTCSFSSSRSVVAAGLAGLQDQMKAMGLIRPSLSSRADDGGLLHGRVRDQGQLDLERRHPDAADLEHVVGASAVDVAAVLVDAVLVARVRPLPANVPRLLALVPVAVSRRRPA